MPLPIDRRRLIFAGTVAALVPRASSEPIAVADPGGDEIGLWPNGTPGNSRVTVREEVVDRLPNGPIHDRFARHVTRPKITLFAPTADWNGVTLLIVPGGGYVRVVIDKEGFESAEWFAARGFAAAVQRFSAARRRLGRRRGRSGTRCPTRHSPVATSALALRFAGTAHWARRLLRGRTPQRPADHRGVAAISAA